jgi:hypothetical protein|tara:strand:+ start:377 stop:571 length:195 start_codon:yes stop_codon:yes gene_type:complete
MTKYICQGCVKEISNISVAIFEVIVESKVPRKSFKIWYCNKQCKKEKDKRNLEIRRKIAKSLSF